MVLYSTSVERTGAPPPRERVTTPEIDTTTYWTDERGALHLPDRLMQGSDPSILNGIKEIPVVEIELPKVSKVEVDYEEGAIKGFNVRVLDGRVFPMKRLSASPAKLFMVNGKPQATVHKDFQPVQNQAVAMRVYGELLDGGHSVTKFKEGSIGNGGSMFNFGLGGHQGVILEGVANEHFGPDQFNAEVSVTNSYNQSVGIHTRLLVHRLICANGLFYPMEVENQRVMHRSFQQDQAVVLARAANAVHNVANATGKLWSHIKEMRTTPIDAQQVPRALKGLRIRQYEAERFMEYSKANVEFNPFKVVDLGKIQYQWDLVNAITDMANHTRKENRAYDLRRTAIDRTLLAMKAGHLGGDDGRPVLGDALRV